MFLSWPSYQSVCSGLFKLLEASQVVAYLGCNIEGTACGSSEMFDYLKNREILHHVPNRRNSFIVYGPGKAPGRLLVGEELAGLCPDILSFKEAQRAAQDGGKAVPVPHSDIPWVVP